jgi:hypothetical protein
MRIENVSFVNAFLWLATWSKFKIGILGGWQKVENENL